MGLGSVLTICSVCKKIKIDKNNDFWLDRNTNPSLYNDFLKKFEGRLSHTYCSEECSKND